MSGWSEKLLDLLYPPKCAFCRKLTEDGSLLCPSCGKTIERTGDNAARRDIPHLALCLSPLYYTGAVQKSLQRYKFHGGAAYYRLYAGLMTECIRAYGETYDRVSWVPLSRKRLRSRGYDQAKLLAEGFAGKAGLDCEMLLKKIRNTTPQSGTGSRAERKTNIRDAYNALHREKIVGKTILLMDDIVTTGATLSECARILKDAGAKQVKALTLARTDLQTLGMEKP